MSNSNPCTRTDAGASPRLEVQMSWWGMTGLGAEYGREPSAEDTVRRIAEAGREESVDKVRRVAPEAGREELVEDKVRRIAEAGREPSVDKVRRVAPEAGRETSAEDKVRRIAEAGFDGINGFIPAPEEADLWHRLLDRYGLSFSVNAYPKTAEDMERFLEAAKAFGRVQFINAQVLTPFLTGEPAEKLLRDITALSHEAGIPVYIETHRGTITQDLLRTVRFTKNIEGLQLTIDYSHYVVAGELHTISGEAEALLQRLLTRTASIHARVSNGEQVQVSVGEDGGHPMLPHFKRWWRSGMRHWLESAGDGGSFPFVCELGPAPYAILAEDGGGRTREISDRWKQSLLLADIARELWREVISEDQDCV